MVTKEKSCLITQNLISSVDWFLTAPDVIIKPERGGNGLETWASKAKKDLIAMLSREKGEFSIDAQQGIKFEKMVYKYANTENIPETASNKFRQVCEEVKGFEFFQKGGKNLTVGEDKCYLYAKYDAIKLPVIKDLKTTGRYKENKYLKGVQHKMYCYISGASEFQYIITEWATYPVIKDVHKEIYIPPSEDTLEQDLKTIIGETLQTLRDAQLFDLYREKYCLY